MACVYITLHVNTAQITKPNIDPDCNFGQPSTTTNEQFTVTVNVGDNVIWQGVSSSNPTTDVVNITAINYEGGNHIFGQNNLRGNGQDPEKVIGTILGGTDGEEETYTIFFTVSNNGVPRNGTFRIDPRIQVH